METQRFRYKDFFSRNDIGAVRAFATGGAQEDDDEPIDDLPPPAWFRRTLSSDPFPPCEALVAWPTNYPVEADADLSEAEWAEDDAAHFRYSEPELEAWQAIVRAVLGPFEGPVTVPGFAASSREHEEEARRTPNLRGD